MGSRHHMECEGWSARANSAIAAIAMFAEMLKEGTIRPQRQDRASPSHPRVWIGRSEEDPDARAKRGMTKLDYCMFRS
jgi:hypothetical protein